VRRQAKADNAQAESGEHGEEHGFSAGDSATHRDGESQHPAGGPRGVQDAEAFGAGLKHVTREAGE